MRRGFRPTAGGYSADRDIEKRRSEQPPEVHRKYTWISAVYGVLCKLLWYIVGLGRVELPTSRLSGPLVGKGCVASCGEFPPVATSRHFRRERERAQKPPPARTQGVHAKAGWSLFPENLRDHSLTNLFRRNRSLEKATAEPTKEVGKPEPPPRNSREIFSSVSIAVPSIYDAPLRQLTPVWRWL